MKRLADLIIENQEVATATVAVGIVVTLIAVSLTFLISPPYSPSSLSTIALFLSGVLAGVIAYVLLILRRRDTATAKIYSALERVQQSLTTAQQTLLAGAIELKKEKWLNSPNISFHFADKEKITNFYNDYFKEPTVEQVVNELVGEVSGEIKGRIPQVIESKVGGKDISKWISTIKLPDISTAEMFRRWQRETIKNNQVILGLELVDVDLSDLEAFDELLTQLRSKFSLLLEESQTAQQRTTLKRKAAENTIRRLESATGMILVEGKFRIVDLSSEFYQCVYDHPVNEYVADEGRNITVSIILRKDALESSIAGNYVQSTGKSIPLTVFGKVWQPVDRKENVWELQITPIAVY